ncbi:MAG: hypothetical protein E6J41_10900 [Chloroflexi bacterium]|nr:MAG: hypothetical protein E6J41_10900 [Chloroflexota bacterium]
MLASSLASVAGSAEPNRRFASWMRSPVFRPSLCQNPPPPRVICLFQFCSSAGLSWLRNAARSSGVSCASCLSILVEDGRVVRPGEDAAAHRAGRAGVDDVLDHLFAVLLKLLQ